MSTFRLSSSHRLPRMTPPTQTLKVLQFIRSTALSLNHMIGMKRLTSRLPARLADVLVSQSTLSPQRSPELRVIELRRIFVSFRSVIVALALWALAPIVCMTAFGAGSLTCHLISQPNWAIISV